MADTRLDPVLELSDPVGVLSIYADADPTLAAGPRPAWAAPVRDGLRGLVKEARAEWPRERRSALEARLEELEPELDALLDPRGSSRGRALFAAVESGELRRVGLRTPLEPLVAFDRRARVLPLAVALRAGRPAGIATVSRTRLVASEWEPDQVTELETVELAEPTAPGRGRPATNPAAPQTFPERDRFESGLDARLAGRVRDAGRRLRGLATERGWDTTLADGDPRLLEALALGFGEGPGRLVESPRPLAGTSPARAAAQAEAVLAELRAQETDRLVALLDTAPTGRAVHGRAAATLALAQGRVEHLLLDPRVDGDEGEELLRRALATGAEIALLEEPAGLLEPDGVAAILRW